MLSNGRGQGGRRRRSTAVTNVPTQANVQTTEVGGLENMNTERSLLTEEEKEEVFPIDNGALHPSPTKKRSNNGSISESER